MKFIFLALSLFSLYLNADEIQRIESVVADIQKLRLDYDKSQEDLSLSLVKLRDEKQKNDILLKRLESKENEIKDLKNQIKSIKNKIIVKNKEKVIIKELSQKCTKKQIEKKNKFPKLMMRDESKKQVDSDTNPHTYRLNKNAKIYDAQAGAVLFEWEERRSFTSNFKSGEWIQITGYFIEKIWHKSAKELWVKEEDAKRR